MLSVFFSHSRNFCSFSCLVIHQRSTLILQRLNQGMDDARALVDDLASQYTQWRDSISECKVNLTSG